MRLGLIQNLSSVIPAQAGIQRPHAVRHRLVARFREDERNNVDDRKGVGSARGAFVIPVYGAPARASQSRRMALNPASIANQVARNARHSSVKL
jgi:hypothetical protein